MHHILIRVSNRQKTTSVLRLSTAFMLEYLGKEVVVAAIREDRYGEYYETDDYVWSEPMIEPEEEPMSVDVYGIL